MFPRKNIIYGGDSTEQETGMLQSAQTSNTLNIYQRFPGGGGTDGPYRIYRAWAEIETYVDGDGAPITNTRPSGSTTYFHITTPTPALNPLRFTVKLLQSDMDRGPTEAGQGPNPHTGKITFLVDQRLGTRTLIPDVNYLRKHLVGSISYTYKDEYIGGAASTDPHANAWEKIARPGYGQGGGGTSQKQARMQATLERMNDLSTDGMTALRMMLSTAEKVGWLPHMNPLAINDINTGNIDSAYNGTSGYYYFRAIDNTNDSPYQGVTNQWVQAAFLEDSNALRRSLKLIWNCIGIIADMLDAWKVIHNANVDMYNNHTHSYVYPQHPGGTTDTGLASQRPQSKYNGQFKVTAQNRYSMSWTTNNVK